LIGSWLCADGRTSLVRVPFAGVINSQ
jgi:hypothetical protein